MTLEEMVNGLVKMSRHGFEVYIGLSDSAFRVEIIDPDDVIMAAGSSRAMESAIREAVDDVLADHEEYKEEYFK